MQLKSVLLLLSGIMLVQFSMGQQRVTRRGSQPGNAPGKQYDPLFRLEQFQGRWQEVKRTTSKSKESVPFTDTLLLKFERDKVEIKDAISMRVSMRGTAQMEAPNFLIAAGDEFMVKYADTQKIVLDDGEYLKELHKTKLFYYETFGKETVVADTLNSPVKVEQKNLWGKWTIYRRQALAGSVSEEAVVIKSIEVFPGDVTGSAEGEVIFYKTDITESAPCKIIFGDNNILVITEMHTWEFSTYKADGKEFVFGEKGRLVYYAKKL
ncbi:MAG: hypothetical protein V9E88_02420 [Ferruginibacter sp.]